jgi:anti-sigma factor RsiW
MTTMPHPTEEALARFRRGELPAPEVARVGLHLAACQECAGAAARSIDVTRSAAALRDDFEEHLRGDEIVAYVGGSASSEEAARAAEHLSYCEACRGDVADLREFSSRRRPRTFTTAWRMLAAAVVMLAIVITVAIALRRELAVPPMTTKAPVDRQRGARDAIVAAALRDGIAKPAVLAAMVQPGQTMRGVPSDDEPRVIEPAGVVVDETRPRFRWRGTADASVTLSIFSGERTVVQTASLHGNEWKPASDLERGATYRWQIEVTTKGNVMIAPSPSDPPALFTVLSDAAHRELDAARRRFANDDLFLGVLTARDGLQGEAVDHLSRYCAANADEKRAAALLREVEAWRTAP